MEAPWLTPTYEISYPTISQQGNGHGVLGLQRDYIDRYKRAGTSVTGEYYANVIKQLRVAIKEKRREKLAAGVLLLHDNAPVHKSRVAQAAIHECKFEQLNHPPYSPDLAPSDYYLFRNLKSHLRGTRFQDDVELKAATGAWFEDQIDDYYFNGIDCLKEKWAKCIEVKGDYIEK